MHIPTKEKILDEIRDYFFISLGCAIYCVAFCLFMLPYHFTPGGMTGVSAIIFYAFFRYLNTCRLICRLGNDNR